MASCATSPDVKRTPAPVTASGPKASNCGSRWVRNEPMARTYSAPTTRPALPVGVTGAPGGVDARPACVVDLFDGHDRQAPRCHARRFLRRRRRGRPPHRPARQRTSGAGRAQLRVPPLMVKNPDNPGRRRRRPGERWAGIEGDGRVHRLAVRRRGGGRRWVRGASGGAGRHAGGAGSQAARQDRPH